MTEEASPTPPYHAVEGATPALGPAAAWAVRLGFLGVGAGLALWIGLRIHAATSDRKALATETARAAASAQARETAPAVVVVRGLPQTWQSAVPFDGTLAPLHEADLGFKAGGRIGAIRVKTGDAVRLGEPLASLEQAEAAASVQAAEAQVRAAQAQLALADDANGRTTAMVDAGAVAEASGFASRQQRALAVAQLDGARAQLALARVALSNHSLLAPFAGHVTRVPPGPGAVVGAGTPLFHLADWSTLKLVGTVGETDARLVRVGATVEIAGAGRVLAGRVVAVIGSVDPATRRVPVEAEIANTGAEPLLAGSFVRGTVKGTEPVAVLRLPASTLRPGSQDEILVVSGGKLSGRRVTFATADDGALLVRAGLAQGDDVMLAPTTDSHDGDLAPETKRAP